MVEKHFRLVTVVNPFLHLFPQESRLFHGIRIGIIPFYGQVKKMLEKRKLTVDCCICRPGFDFPDLGGPHRVFSFFFVFLNQEGRYVRELEIPKERNQVNFEEESFQRSRNFWYCYLALSLVFFSIVSIDKVAPVSLQSFNLLDSAPHPADFNIDFSLVTAKTNMDHLIIAV